MAGEREDKRRNESAHLQRRDGKDVGVQDVSISSHMSYLTCDGKGIDAQRCRDALGRASPSILGGSLESIGSSELPRVVAGQATRVLARGGAQCMVESAMSGGVCRACAGKFQRVLSR